MPGKSKSTPQMVRDREQGFVLAPSQGIPAYNAETDPYCPRAQVRKYNNDRRINAEEAASKGRRAETWIRKTMQSKFDEVPQKFNPSLRTKAQQAGGPGGSGPESLAEVEILQKVIVRENLLAELQKLLHNQNDVSGCLGEVVELVKAIRYQTVDIVEDVDSWQYAQPTPRPFLYRGVNYLIKLFSDLNFLDVYQDIVEKFCFEFTSNPLAYRGGGDIATGTGGNARSTLVDRLSQQYNASAGSFDGIEVIRLRNAERTIQREFDRLDRGRQLFGQQSQQMLLAAASIEAGGTVTGDGGPSMAIGEAAFGGSVVAQGGGGGGSISSPYQAAFGAGSLENSHDYYRNDQSVANQTFNNTNANAANSKYPQHQQQHQGRGKMVPKTDARRKWRQKFSQRKVKLERIATLSEEATELKAMQTHIEEKISALVEQHRALVDKRKLSEGRRKEALALDREAAAQHFAVEISVYTADMQDINAKIKDFQRQNYFISIERNRKRKVVAKLKDEVEIEKKRAVLEERLAGKIKEGGILNALKTLNLMQSQALNDEMGVTSLGSAGGSVETNSLLEFIHQQADKLGRPTEVPEVKYGGMESEQLRNIYYQEDSLEEDDGDVEYLVEEGESTAYKRQEGQTPVPREEDEEYEEAEAEADHVQMGEKTGEEEEADGDVGGPSDGGLGEGAWDSNAGYTDGSQGVLALGGALLEDSLAEGSMAEGEAGNLNLNLDADDEGAGEGEGEQDVQMPSGERLSALLASATGDDTDRAVPVGTAYSLAKSRREGKLDTTEHFQGLGEADSRRPAALDDPSDASVSAAAPASPTPPLFIADLASSEADLVPHVRSAYEAYSAGELAVCKLMIDSILKARRRMDLGPSHVILGTRYLVAEWYRSHGLYDKAQEMYRKVLDLLEEDGGRGAVLGGTTLRLFALVGLADVHRNTGRLEEAEASLFAAQRLVPYPSPPPHEEQQEYQSLHGLPPPQAHQLAVSELHACQGALSVAKGSYDEAHGYYSAALEARTSALGGTHCRVGSVLTHLARVACLRCRFSEALSLCLQGLALKQQGLPEGHLSLAASFYCHADILRGLGRYAEAAPLLAQCLSMRQAALGEDHAAVAQAHWAAAELSRETGQPQRAAEGFDLALRLRQRCFPKPSPEAPWHPAVVESISSMAANAEAAGRYLEALPLYEQVLAMREEAFAAMGIQRHPEVALSQLHVARLRLLLNRFEDDSLEGMFCAAGRALRQTLGSTHCHFAAFLLAFGELCSQQGRFSLAHVLLERSLAVLRALLADTCPTLDEERGSQHAVHPTYAAALHASAANMLQPGCFVEALARCEAAAAIMLRVFGPASALAAPCLTTRARLLCLLQRAPEAEIVLRNALASLRESGAESSAAHAVALGEYGECLRLQGPERIDEADGSLSSGLRARRAAFGSTHRLVADSMRCIAFLSLDRGRKDDALALMRDGALPLFETVLGPEHPETMWTSGNVGLFMMAADAGGESDAPSPAESLLTSSLDFLGTYEYGRFAPEHPLIKRLGGYRPTDDGSRRNAAETVEAILDAAHRPRDDEVLREWV